MPPAGSRLAQKAMEKDWLARLILSPACTSSPFPSKRKAYGPTLPGTALLFMSKLLTSPVSPQYSRRIRPTPPAPPEPEVPLPSPPAPPEAVTLFVSISVTLLVMNTDPPAPPPPPPECPHWSSGGGRLYEPDIPFAPFDNSNPSTEIIRTLRIMMPPPLPP